MTNLFGIYGDDLDPGYVNLRDHQYHAEYEIREYCESLWTRFEPHADPHFVSQFARNVQERYWEMYIGCVLLDLGYEISSTSKGPDLSFHHDGQKYWVEAICPTMGQKGHPDQVPDLIPINEGGTAQEAPIDKIVLRLTAAFREKSVRFEKWLQDGTVEKGDRCIIALSGGNLGSWMMGGGSPPYILRALFPIGGQYVTFDKNTMEVTDSGVNYQPYVVKSGGTEIAKTAFVDPAHEHIAGVVYTRRRLGIPPTVLGEDLFTIHNPMASHQMSKGLIRRGQEWCVEGDELVLKDWATE